MPATGTLADALATTCADTALFGPSGPCPLRLEPHSGAPRVVLVTGENASGKSLVCRFLGKAARDLGIDVVPLGMDLRTAQGMQRAVVYGHEGNRSTGQVSMRAALTGLKKPCRERGSAPDGPRRTGHRAYRGIRGRPGRPGRRRLRGAAGGRGRGRRGDPQPSDRRGAGRVGAVARPGRLRRQDHRGMAAGRSAPGRTGRHRSALRRIPGATPGRLRDHGSQEGSGTPREGGSPEYRRGAREGSIRVLPGRLQDGCAGCRGDGSRGRLPRGWPGRPGVPSRPSPGILSR